MIKRKGYIFPYGNFESEKGFAIRNDIYKNFLEFISSNENLYFDSIESSIAFFDEKEDFFIDLFDKFSFFKKIDIKDLNYLYIYNNNNFSNEYKYKLLNEIKNFDITNYLIIKWDFRDELIDFNKYKSLNVSFGGTDKKDYKLINNNIWMLKYEDNLKNENNKDFTSYRNNVFSEYISCHIIDSIGLDVQNTKIGKNNNKLVVGCKDICGDINNRKILFEFKDFESETLGVNKRNSDLEDILYIIKNNEKIINSNFVEKSIERFWQTLIVDSILCNFDRHTGNWGYLSDINNLYLAPIYDCGACLFSKFSDEKINDMFNDNSIKNCFYNIPSMSFTYKNNKISYFEFIRNFRNEELIKIGENILENINLNRIYQIINSCPELTDIRRKFYCELITERVKNLKKIIK